MEKFLTFLAKIYISLYCARLIKSKAPTILFHQPSTTSVDKIRKTIHADTSFTQKEQSYILQAAQDWHFFSNGRIEISIVFDLDVNQSCPHQSIMLRTSICQEVEECDIYFGNKILGLYYPNVDDMECIYLIYERLTNPDMFRTTVIHELGHLLGLTHTFNKSIMFKYNCREVLYPNYYDAQEFAKIYNCNPTELRYFKSPKS